ncbi:NERD domain-containing protein [Nocardiopsis exhalans]|uniref:NERD domain-containing protein n=1 Tax=Nocardiopsis exhalans TaxID=163604 RepID=A0ABY5D5H9_9ACTN|nr:nuclease-related domain-containing protein [Nocardiopsis exhalans]USY18125.1 NERD domain-containing protein [Nocardiopsis exhalans]
MAAAPSVAVVLVGQNPTPALLSALTLPVDHLLLVASDGTLAVARRVARAVEALAADRSVRVLSVGSDPHDPGRVAGLLESVRTALNGRPWYLDYTGGTKVMSVAAALHHEHALPPEARAWRFYLDSHSDLLRSADTASPGRPVTGQGVDLRTLAGIHGARWLADRDPKPLRLFLDGGPAALAEAFPKLPESELNGIAAEGRVLAHLRRLLGGRPDSEVLGSRRVADPFRPGGSIADFDILVRHRHRVLCVETKSRAEDVVARAGWTVAKARRVFGGATHVLFVYSGPVVADLRDQVTAYNPALSARHVHVWNLDALTERVNSFDAVRDAFFPSLADTPARAAVPDVLPPEPGPVPDPGPPLTEPPVHHPGPEEAPLLVTPLGGSRLGALAAMHAHRPARALVLPSKQSLRARVREAAARALRAAERPDAPPADSAALRAEGYRDRVRLAADPVDGYDSGAVQRAVQEWIESERAREADGHDAAPPIDHALLDDSTRSRPVIVDITTGTKAMSLGLARAARHGGACATYQLPRERAVVCLTHGRRGLAGRARIDWSLVLSGYEPLPAPLSEVVTGPARDQVDVALLELAGSALVAAATGECEVWWDVSLSDPQGFLTAQERPGLVLTFDDRAVGLTAPARLRRRTAEGPLREVSPGAWAQSVFAATTHLNARCDVAGRVLALTRPGRNVTRAGELVDWIAQADPEAPDLAEELNFGEPLRPLVVVVDPARPPKVLATDVSLL